MRYLAIFLVAFLAGLATVAQGRDSLITIYNYTPPLPTLLLVSITPQNQQTFDKGAPRGAALLFSQSLVPEKSDVKIYDQYNNLVSAEKTMSKDTRMEAPLPQHLFAGTYRIEWTATCACGGNPINGTSYFTVY